MLRFSPSRIWLHESAWLLGSWAFSWASLSPWLGYSYLWRPQLDIQMHNTFFVVPPVLLTTLVFLPVATAATGVRVLVGGLRNLGPNVVLGFLVGIWMLLGAVVAAAMWHKSQQAAFNTVGIFVPAAAPLLACLQ